MLQGGLSLFDKEMSRLRSWIERSFSVISRSLEMSRVGNDVVMCETLTHQSPQVLDQLLNPLLGFVGQ